MKNQNLSKVKKLSSMVILFLLSSCGPGLQLSSDPASTTSNSTSTSSGRVPVCTNCKMFMTATTNNGQLGGTAAAAITAADNICMADANKPADGATYKALMVNSARVACTSAFCAVSGESEHVDWVLFPNVTYYRSNGTTVIGTTNSLSIFTGAFTNSIVAAGSSVWTGLADLSFPTISNFLTGANTCVNWTSSNGAQQGVRASSNDTNSNALTSGSSFCNNALQIYCVAQ